MTERESFLTLGGSPHADPAAASPGIIETLVLIGVAVAFAGGLFMGEDRGRW
jgi:hypothetical protein